MDNNFFKGPGDDDLKRMIGPNPITPDSTSRSSDSLLVNRKSGGLGGAAKNVLEERIQTNKDSEDFDIPVSDSPPTEDKPNEDSALLSDPKWTESDTLFHQDEEVTVKLALPKGKEHVTRIEAELFAKKASGPESISKGEGFAQADGTAVITLPVYKPKGYQDGPVEYFVRFMHKMAKMVSTEKDPRKVSETALKSVDHILVSGIAFDKGTSFINPKAASDLKRLESRFKEWDKKFPKNSQIAIFGHADTTEKDAKGLSERRAQSSFAFITNDASIWETLYSAEKWGLKPLQWILKDLGYYDGTLDGQNGPKTQTAFKGFQNKAGLPESGDENAVTRKAMFTAYMKGKHDIQIEASRFCQVAANSWMGCGQNNHAKDGEGDVPENRRVAFILINPSKHFPVNFPCQDGSEPACQAQCKKAGKRSAAGIKCLFYDEMVREEKQADAIKDVPESEETPPWMKFAKKELADHVTEIKGPENNPRILEYHQTTRQKMNNDDQTGAWCAAFVNWCLFKSGNTRMNRALASDWKNFGRKVEEPVIGSVAVVHFEEGGYHVGFVAGKKGNRILLLGGNQDGGTRVSISGFPKTWIQRYGMPEEYSGQDQIAEEKEGNYGQDSYAGTR